MLYFTHVHPHGKVNGNKTVQENKTQNILDCKIEYVFGDLCIHRTRWLTGDSNGTNNYKKYSRENMCNTIYMYINYIIYFIIV